MNKNCFSLCVFLIFFGWQLSALPMHGQHKEQRLDTLRLYSTPSLKIIEKNEIPISKPKLVRFSPKNEKILLLTGKVAHCIDYQTGEVIKAWSYFPSAVDSAVQQVNGKLADSLVRKFEFIPRKDIVDTAGKPMAQDFFQTRMGTSITDGDFVSEDTLLLTVHIDGFKADTTVAPELRHMTQTRYTALIKVNLHSEYFTVALLDDKNELSLHNGEPGKSLWIPSTRTITFPIFQMKILPGKSVFYVLNSFNEKGEFKETLPLMMPEEYRSPHLGYTTFFQFLTDRDSHDNLFMCWSFLERVQNMKTLESINFKSSFALSNDSLFDFITKNPQGSPFTFAKKIKLVTEFFAVTPKQTFLVANYERENYTASAYYRIVEVDTAGKIIKTAIILPGKGEIFSFCFDKKNNKFGIICLQNEHWGIHYYSW